jgi:predicted metal-dependent peptidase
MKFNKVVGKIDPNLVAKAEDALSKVFLDLALKYDNTLISPLGGDPLIFTLMYPVEHICTMNISTAATDGKRYYWNPKFILTLSREGLRFVCAHEAWHAIYMHPSRRGGRNPKLWNIAVDYIVNDCIMDDLKTRKQDPGEMFKKHLGNYMTLAAFANMIKDPFKKIPGVGEIDTSSSNAPQVTLPGPEDDRELTEDEMKELERREKRHPYYYADPDLSDDMKSPEKIYEYLYNLLPKCPDCGSLGKYKQKSKSKSNQGKKSNKGNKGDKAESKDKGDQDSDGSGDSKDQHDHGDGQKCGCNDPHGKGQGNEQGEGEGEGDSNSQGQGQGQGQGQQCGGCGTCGDGVDIFDIGGTLDDHMDSTESEEKISKRIYEAIQTAKKMAGQIPAGLEDELGILSAPKISWRDVIRSKLLKSRSGHGRNDWTRFKSRPMFAGLMVPKSKSYYANFGCLLDTSGSMSQEDMAFGISQLISLDEKAEGTITCGDCEIYWDSSTKIRKANPEELSKVKVVGRGGTMFSQYFKDYKEYIGECDFLICITDGYLGDEDFMVDPGIPVYWLITSGHSSFKPAFGKSFDLMNA